MSSKETDQLPSEASPVEDTPEESIGWTDEQFQQFLIEELARNPLSKDYPDIFEVAPVCITKWRQRYRGEPLIWKRIFQKDRVIKEFVEAVPIIDAVQRVVNEKQAPTSENDHGQQNDKFTIVDLASGRGYLSMLLSELLSPEKVERFVLIDKAWPMHGSTPQPHHISWTHIYGSRKEGEGSRIPCYYDTWPIPLNTSKQDLKHANQRRNMEQQFFSNSPVILLAVHLCGTLSIKAVELFNRNPAVQFFCLKPCCLPGMIHSKRHEVFELGHHSFEAKEVCMPGKWKKNVWKGPPRSQLKDYFDRWCQNLYLGLDDNNARRIQTKVMVQTSGGYQNEFLFAERSPISQSLWEKLKYEQGEDTMETIQAV